VPKNNINTKEDAKLYRITQFLLDLPEPEVEVSLLSLDEFSSPRYGNPLVVLVNGKYVLTIARSDAYPSNSLENIMGYEDTDWEIETDIGFVHNSSAYIEATT
jgi:hypothetical protein